MNEVPFRRTSTSDLIEAALAGSKPALHGLIRRTIEETRLDGNLIALAVEDALRGDKIGKSKRKRLKIAFDKYREAVK